MKTNNLSNLIFAALVLFFVLIGNVYRSHPETSTLQENINETALRQETGNLSFLNYQVPPALNISSPVALAKYLDRESGIFEKNSRQRWPLASLTKLMTALVAMEKMNLRQPIVLNQEAVAEEGIAGNFQVGEIFSTEDLLKALLAVSSNDAAKALAGAYGETEFIAAMREKAFELDMPETDFSDVDGLSSLNQSTAADLEKLIRYIFLRQPKILEITQQSQVEITELKSKIKRRLVNINEFTGRADFLGGKTGFTDEASGNLVSLFRHNNQPLLIIVFGTDDRFGQTKLIYDYLRGY